MQELDSSDVGDDGCPLVFSPKSYLNLPENCQCHEPGDCSSKCCAKSPDGGNFTTEKGRVVQNKTC